MTTTTATSTGTPLPPKLQLKSNSVSEFVDLVRAWLDSVTIPAVAVEENERFTVLRAWQRTLYDAGFMGVDWAVESGGQGLTPQHRLAFMRELARAHAPAPIGLIGLDVVGPSIEKYGTPEQRRTLLPSLLSGEEIWCQGFSEPGAGSDLASLRTRATLNGDVFRVDGQKVWTSWASRASRCALLCVTDPEAVPHHRGLSYLLVDMNAPGVAVRPIRQMTGDAEFCEVFFDGVEVPRSQLLGSLNDGWRIALDTLSSERGNYAMRRLVEIGWLLEDTIDELTRSGKRLDARTDEAIGRAHVALAVLESQIARTTERLTSQTGPDPVDSIDKLVLNEAEQVVCESLVALAGPFRAAPQSRPFGLRVDRLVHDHVFSRAASIYGGTSQIQRNIVAERLLGLPKG
jgi:alkylation response protein AidB-like acyl-CoA dehydrogenase